MCCWFLVRVVIVLFSFCVSWWLVSRVLGVVLLVGGGCLLKVFFLLFRDLIGCWWVWWCWVVLMVMW